MSSLADLSDLVGFFSYSRSDDEHSDGALSALRERIRKELRMQLGRELRLWQDVEAIALGTLWEGEIRKAIAESAFFIPIVSPSALNSKFCRMEFEAFLARESELARSDLVFPILFIPVPGLADAGQRSRDEVLKIINARQYADWTDIRLDDVDSVGVKKEVARFCKGVVEALRKAWESPEKRRRRKEAEAQRLAEEEGQRVEKERRRKAEAEAQRRTGVERGFGGTANGTSEQVKPDAGAVRELRLSPLALAAAGMLAVVLIGSVFGWLVMAPPSAPKPPRPADASDAHTTAPLPSATAAAEAPARRSSDLASAPAAESKPQGAVAAPLTAAQERALKPKDSFKECADCPEMVVVPAGAFTMGSPESESGRYSNEAPQHVVTISKPFAVGRLHVTVDQFAAFVRETGYEASSKCFTFEGYKVEQRANRSWRNPGFPQEGSHPTVCLSWDDAKAYADWLAKKIGKPYRMLTEAEWEYASRGRTSPGAYPRFWFGDDEQELCRYGNGADQKAQDSIEGAKSWPVAPCNDGYAYTSPAGYYQPNAFGLYDMSGNAWQWTADCWHDSYNGAPADGSAWTSGCQGSGRVVRGGSWVDFPWFLRSAQRSRDTVENYLDGFRLARTLTP